MKRTQILRAVVVIASVAIVGAVIIYNRHSRDAAPTPSASRSHADVVAPAVADSQIAAAIQQAGAEVRKLEVHTVGGVVVLKGIADAVTKEKAASVVRSLGVTRVANLINAGPAIDDEEMRREAERQLAATRGLDGCELRVSCDRGILRVEGTAKSELQMDIARTVLKHVAKNGQEVRVDLTRASS